MGRTVREINDAIMHARENNPTSAENAGGKVPISKWRFAKAKKKLHGATRFSHVPIIYRVLDELKYHANVDEYYRPFVVHLGCYADYNKRSESKLQKYKWCCVRQLIGRNNGLLEPAKTHVLLEGCMETMKRLLPRVRASYCQPIDVYYEQDDDKVATLMVLDGCFILHRLLKYANPGQQSEDDDWTQVYGHCFVWQSVTRDLLLLENQIPFFVFRELFQLLKNEDEAEESLFTGSLRLFRSLGLQMQEQDILPQERGNIHHLLHLFYVSVGFPQQSVPAPYRIQEPGVFLPDLTQWIPSTKELEEAGVRFRKKRDPTSFLDVSFDNRHGILEIPLLQLYDSSSSLFRNLIAFEQAYPATRCNVSTYAVFMDCLINTPEDMRILHLRGILSNRMSGEQDPSRFFSQVCAGVHFPADNYLVDLVQEVNKYKESRRHKWRSAFVRNYCGNPWLAMSVFAAVLLLGFTVLQTFFTVYPYYKPSG